MNKQFHLAKERSINFSFFQKDTKCSIKDFMTSNISRMTGRNKRCHKFVNIGKSIIVCLSTFIRRLNEVLLVISSLTVALDGVV